MKKGILFLLLSVLTIGAWAQSSPNVVVADDINSYSGTETYVFSKADGKIYVHNNLGAYERYGVYERVTSLKTAGDNISEIEYIATKGEDGTANVPYLNTGYIPKANTRIVLDVDIENSTAKNWMAVFGARQGGWTSHAYVLFARAWGNQKGCFNRTNDEHAADSDIPRNQRMTIDALGKTCTFTLADQSEPALTITTNDGSTVEDCTNNLFIFDTNTAGAGGNTRDNSYCFMKLYGCKIYEGETLVKDYVPVYNNSLAKGGVKDKLSGDVIYSSSSREFAVSDDAHDAGVPVYEGKMVYNTTDGKIYEYTGSAYVERGSVTMEAIANTEYKNMKNWGCPDGHWESVFDSGNNIQWDEANQTNRFDPYVGTGGWEPLHRTINVEAEQDYNVSFNYSTGGWNTWNTNHTETPDPISLPFKIIDRENYDQNLGFYTDAGLIGSAKLTNSAASQELISVDFTSTTGVARFIIQFGVVDDGEHNPAYWFSFDNWEVKKYIYPKAYPVLNPFGPEIEDLLPQVAAFDKTTTTNAIATLLDAAVNAAQVSLENPDDLAAQKEALENLEDIFATAQAANVTTLRATIAYVKAKGVDASAQEDYLVNGTTNDVQNQINGAVIALKQALAERSTQPTIFTLVSESVVGTDDNTRGTVVTDHAYGFYVYNVGTGRWFCGGDEWGAHAAVGFPGIKVTTPENNYGSGQYNSVVTWLFNGNWGSSGQLNHGGYCDTGGNGWKFWQQDASQGIFTWAQNGDNTGDNTGLGCGTQGLVGFAPSTYARVNTDRTDADNPYNQWIFVTEAQRDEMAAAAMPTASETSPVDLTYKIKMPGFNQRERKEETNQDSEELDWTCNHANYRYNASDNGSRLLIMGRGDNHADFVCDVYGDQWNDAFSMTQTITGLQSGRYRVKVQGYNNGGDAANKAYLEANGQKTTLVERSSESVLPWTTKLPENTFDNPEYFQVGLYWNEVLCNVGSNGELTLGVKSPSVTGGHVVIFDNFRLEYIGLAGVEIGDANYTTFVAPYDIDTMPGGVEAYACQVLPNEYVHLEPVTAIPAGEAVVLKNTGTYKFSPAAGSVELGTNNDLLPSDGNVQGGENIYALANKANGVGFYPVKSTIKVPAGKGYLVIGSGEGNIKAFYGFDDEDDPTSIENVNLNVNLSETIYNLAGQRMSKKQQGINIVNGKKILK